MIESFADKESQNIFDGIQTKKALKRLHPDYWPKTQRLMDQLNRITRVEQMDVPPNNRLHKLKGAREGQWSVWINQSHRLVFIWDGHNANSVEVVDYHDE